MRRLVVLLTGLLTLGTIPASAQVVQVHLTYDTYALGLRVMQMHVFFGLGPWNYQIKLDYHTTGVVGFFYSGKQVNTVRGKWDGNVPQPSEFFGHGVWHGQDRRTLIDYNAAEPDVKTLIPPQETEREPVPEALRLHTIDTLSALVQLMHQVDRGGSCETQVHTYDGRRVLEVSAHTGGEEKLLPSHGSVYRGEALRCDFEGHEIAGFLKGEDDPEHRKPLHGSAWFAPMTPGGPPMPVRIAFQTRWFGWTTMYLTDFQNEPPEGVARNP